MNSKILLINKERGISSYKKIREVQKQYRFNKIGHVGTLDPMAEGLIMAISDNATKLSNFLMKQDKIYEVEMQLYYQTDTLDLEGKIVYSDDIREKYNIEDITNAMNAFIGEILQKPPMYSAIKINGKKLYNLARKEIFLDVPERPVNIYYIENIKTKDDDKISFTTKVSSGTYIRSLVRDIAIKLGTYATMTALKRVQIGDFKLPPDVSEIDVDNAIKLEKIYLSYKQYFELKNGMTIICSNKFNETSELLHAYYENNYVGIIKIIDRKNCDIYLKRTKFFE
ncbi:tRNA pseudouridine(55) synthase TruB [Caviibacter abscessus]|uniref:tRNA pseudouridine(55) synthase TruB n=1 Tax=Caviibacter abscessus TaxID=1766719 RepID=UPI00082FE795|nr:tRNA pseudouridine(55) synthase TruB [Caviibacter abscessus]